MTKPVDPIARVIRLRELALAEARARAGRAAADLGAIETTVERLRAIGRSYATAGALATGAGLAEHSAARARLSRAIEASESRRRHAERQVADARLAMALAQAAVNAAEEVHSRRRLDARRALGRRMMEADAGLARALHRVGGDIR